ncbi:MAG: replicative DNA helicase [Firmicutes bacterium]|nr:replicative DNA helicase [Bacillota bacterium]
MEKVPPQNLEAERAILGAIMIDRDAILNVSDILRPEHFYKEAHKEIYDAALTLYRDGEPVDLVTVGEMLKRRKMLDPAGGRAYLGELTGAVVSTANVEKYAKIVEEKAALRNLIKASSEIVEDGYTSERDTAEILEAAEEKIFAISQRRQRKSISHIRDVIDRDLAYITELSKQAGELRGISTGFSGLDRITSGLQKSDLIIIAARPSMGKTAFALNIAVNAAKTGSKVLLFSLEMSEELLTERMLSAESLVEIKKMREGALDDEEFNKMYGGADRLNKLEIYIDDTPGISPLEIKNKCKRIKMEKKGLDLVIVDYLQLMIFEGKSENRTLEISALTRYLKQLAREIDCPVIVLSQLSRGVESRTDKRPVLSDLRESGSIEQDADLVMFLYREEYYKKEESTRPGECDIIIAKHRNGPTDTVTLTWVGKYTRFADMAREG